MVGVTKSGMRTVVAGALSMVLFLPASSPAYAPSTYWQSPHSLSPISPPASGPQVAVNPRGDTVAAWTTGDPEDKGAVFVSRRPVNKAWSKPIRVSGIYAGGRPVVAIGDRGTIVVAWTTDQEGKSLDVVANFFTPGKGWGKPHAMTRTDAESGSPDVAIRGSVAILAYAKVEGIASEVEIRRRSKSGQWGKARRISRKGMVAGRPSLDIDGLGRASLAFAEQEDGQFRVAVRVETEVGAWGARTFISGLGVVADNPVLDETRDGDAVLLWRELGAASDSQLVMAHRAGATAAFGATTALSPAADFEVFEYVASSNETDDVFTMAWVVGQGSIRELIARRRDSFGALSTQTLVSTPGADAVAEIAVSTSAQQTSVVLWREADSGVYRIKSRTISIILDWQPSETVSTLTQTMAVTGDIADGSHRVATAVWLGRDSSNQWRVIARDWDPLKCTGICPA